MTDETKKAEELLTKVKAKESPLEQEKVSKEAQKQIDQLVAPSREASIAVPFIYCVAPLSSIALFIMPDVKVGVPTSVPTFDFP